jgi:hypothetical protein
MACRTSLAGWGFYLNGIWGRAKPAASVYFATPYRHDPIMGVISLKIAAAGAKLGGGSDE